MQIRIAHAPIVTHRGERFPSGAIECHRRAVFSGLSALIPRAHADHPVTVFQQTGDGDFFFHDRARLARMLHQRQVELRSQDLPGLGHILIVAREKIKRLRDLARGRHKLHTVFLDERGLSHLLDEAEPFQGIKRKRQQRFPNVIARKFFAFERQHLVAVPGQDRRRCGTGRPGADDNDVVIVFSVLRWVHHAFQIATSRSDARWAGGKISTISAK